MKKKVLSILLLFLYLIPSIGVSGSVHYCGGEVAAIVIIPTNEHPCPCGPSEDMADGCCQDEAFSFKIKDNHKSSVVKIPNLDLEDWALIKSETYYNWITQILLKEENFPIREAEPPDIKFFELYESYLI